MSIGPLIGIASNLIGSLFSPGAAPNGSAQHTNTNSPFAEVLSSLQQLASSNPSRYQQVTQQISVNLQSAARTATAKGDAGLASDLTRLSQDFSGAAGTGRLPKFSHLTPSLTSNR